MNIVTKIRIKHIIALLSIMSFFNACEVPNLNDSQYLPTITTSEVSEITALSAISGGVITNDGGYDVTARGACWDTVPNQLYSLDYSHTTHTDSHCNSSLHVGRA